MADRITVTQLRARVARLNDLFDYPRDPYSKNRDERGYLVANAGTFTVDGAYGGWRLYQMGKGGCERDLTPRGGARATYNTINAYIAGAEAMKRKLQG